MYSGYSSKKNKTKAKRSKQKDFCLPPILPIVFYEGEGKWTAKTNFEAKVYLSDIFSKYIPSFVYEVIDLNNYTVKDLIKMNNILSLIMLIDKIKKKEDFNMLHNIPKEYIDNITKTASPSLLELLVNTIELFLEKVNIPENEIREITDKVQERSVSEMFTMIEEYDVQKERKKMRKEMEQEVRETVIRKVKEELKEEVKETVKEELKEEIKETVKKELKEEVKETVKKELKEEVKEEITQGNMKDIAQTLLLLGDSIEKVQQVTQLPIEIILEIQKIL